MKLFRPIYSRVVNGKKVKKRASKWYVRLPGQRKPVPLCRNKEAAEQLAAQLLTNHERAAVGLDDYRAHGERLIQEHIDEWVGSLKNRCSSVEHVQKSRRRVERVMAAAGIVVLRELDPERVLDALAAMERAPAHPGVPPQEWFTVEEAGAILGVAPKSVARLAKRHDLPAQGSTHKRQYPRATVEALLARKQRGRCASTVNVYVVTLQAFARWLVKRKRLKENPLADLEKRQVSETRHARRALPVDELAGLLAATRSSAWAFRGLTGEDRYHLYLLAMSTGLRRAELATVGPRSFGPDCLSVTVAGAYTKNRKTATQPLPADVAEAFRDYVQDKPDRPLWPSKWQELSAQMIRHDLKEAGIPYSVPGPDGPLFADLHALRHSYITLLIRGGGNPKVVQRLARHSTPQLTLQRYTHVQAEDAAEAIEVLPALAKPCARLAQAQVNHADGSQPELVGDARDGQEAAIQAQGKSTENRPKTREDGQKMAVSGPHRPLEDKEAHTNVVAEIPPGNGRVSAEDVASALAVLAQAGASEKLLEQVRRLLAQEDRRAA